MRIRQAWTLLLGGTIALLSSVSFAKMIPSLDLDTEHSPKAVNACLEQRIKALKIPSDYFKHTIQPNGEYTLEIANPFTGNTGMEITVQEGQVQMFEFGPKFSKNWHRIVEVCAAKGR